MVILENVIDGLKKEKLDLCKTIADIRKKNVIIISNRLISD